MYKKRSVICCGFNYLYVGICAKRLAVLLININNKENGQTINRSGDIFCIIK